jgi:hypothetical protein
MQLTARFLILLAIGGVASPLSADDGSGMKTSASVDMVGGFSASKAAAKDRVDVREAEFMLYGPVDHLFEGLLSVAAHQEKGVALFEVHEAHISTSKWIPRSRLKVGQYFLGIGRLNRFHRHEWPFISTPKVHAAFFGEEGVLDSGLEYGWIAPTPFYLDWTVGVTNGWVYGHAHSEGERPVVPTHYTRFGTYFDLMGGGVQTGVSYLHRVSAQRERMTLVGMDVVGKWRSGKTLVFMAQGEVWHRSLEPEASGREESLGAYLIPQLALTELWLLGIRFDYFTILNFRDAVGKRVPNHEFGVVPTLTLKPSEFSTVRLALNHSRKETSDASASSRSVVEIQTTFTLGAHPAHEF